MFSDEKVFWSTLKTRPQIKRPRGTRNDEANILSHTNMSSFKINVWGYMAYGVGIRVFQVDEDFNSPKYIECLRSNFINDPIRTSHTVFHQDNCSIHTTPEVFSFFRENNVNVITHPPGSPDLNPLENGWHLGQRKLNEFLRTDFVTTKAHLFELVKGYLEGIPVEMVNRLIDSMPDRTAEIHSNGGGKSHY